MAQQRRKSMQVVIEAARSLSLSNLCFISSWNDLLDSSARNPFNVFNYSSYVVIVVNVLVLGAFFFGVARLARRLPEHLSQRIAPWLLSLLLLVPANGALTILYPDFSLTNLLRVFRIGYFNPTELMVIGTIVVILGAVGLAPRFKLVTAVSASAILLALGRPEPAWLAVLLSIFFVLVVMRWKRIVVRTVSTMLLVLTPFVLITFVQAARVASKIHDKPSAPLLKGRDSKKARVLWMVFDEMDQSMTFDRRHPTLKLPEIDRLREQAIYASSVYPASNVTLMSLPALVSGRFITHAEISRPSELMITYAGSKDPVKWSTQPSIFSKARDHSVNSAVVGWYHPYCRILGDSLAKCSFQEFGRMQWHQSATEQLKELARTIPLTSYYGLFADNDPELHKMRQEFLQSYLGALEQSKKFAIDQELGLILVHWPIPHPPAIFNHLTNSFDISMSSGYLGNLALVDRTIGQLRREMENAGLWDDTVVLITSDHWFRSEIHFRAKEDDETLRGAQDHRVPFILKLAGQKERVDYSREFNNVVIHDLILGILRDELKSPESVVRWLDNQDSIGESPYYFKRRK
jgi:hypothetical protein